MKYAIENGMLDLSYIQEKLEMNKRKELLEKHPWSISQGKDGKWRTYLPDEKSGRRMIKRNSKKSIEDDVIAFWKRETENPKIRELFYEWIHQKLEYNDICIGTFNRYEADFKKFFEDESKFAEKRIRDVSANEIKPFIRKAISFYSLSAKGYSNLRTLVFGIFKYAKEMEYITWSISQTVNDMEIPKKSFRKVVKEDDEEVFSDNEIEKLFGFLMQDTDMLDLGIILMFCTGVRVGELVAIKKEDISGNSIKIRRTEITYKENGETICEVRDYPKTEAGIRTVFVPTEFSSVLDKLQNMSMQNDYLFQIGEKRIKAMQIRRRLYLACKKTGIKKKSPHKLRKTYISILLDNGVDKRLVQDVAGHAEILTSERNYHRNRKSDDKKEKILSNLPEFKSVKLWI